MVVVIYTVEKDQRRSVKKCSKIRRVCVKHALGLHLTEDLSSIDMEPTRPKRLVGLSTYSCQTDTVAIKPSIGLDVIDDSLSIPHCKKAGIRLCRESSIQQYCEYRRDGVVNRCDGVVVRASALRSVD